MVKRSKTPEGPEPCKYYTCWKPYPLNADFELSEDYINFSRWIANILGDSGPLYSLYYKPRVSAVIFSVDKEYPRPERLLGEHRWDEFLKRVDKSTAGLKSQIFYCTYGTDRELQKDGWKCIPVEEYFFKNWGIDKWFTKVPYPAPHWCKVPAENMAEKPLCRNLPSTQVQKSQVPIQKSQAPAPVQRPVVGSSDWAQMRDKNAKLPLAPIATGGGNTSSSQNKAPGAAKGKGKKTGVVPNQASFPPLSPTSPTNPDSVPPVTTARSVWESKPSNVKSASPWSAPPTSTAHMVWKTVQSTSRTGNTSASQTGSMAGNSSKAINKASSLDDETGKSRPRSPSSSSEHSEGWTAASSAPSSPMLSSSAHGEVTVHIDVNDYENDDEDVTEETYHEDWETASAYQPSEVSAPTVHVGKNKSNRWEYPPLVVAIERENEVTQPVVEENLWADVPIISPSTGSKAAAEAHAKKVNEIVCPVHQGKCKKGICKAYKELERAERKKKKKEESKARKNAKKDEEEKEDGQKAKEGLATDGAKKGAWATSQSQDRDKKPMGSRWEDYSSDEDDLGALPSFSGGRRPGGKKYDADEEFFD